MAVLAGIAFRLDGLARRPLWYDEAATVLHVSGRSEDALRAWYDGRPLGRAAVLGSPASVAAAVAAARRDEPQSGPLYFAAAAAWQGMTGGSLVALRMLSVAASVLAVAAAYLLARRVFADTRVALVADARVALVVAALVALSPLHIRYAQEARPYALWSLALLVWALATLRADAREGRGQWAIAAGTMVLALLVHPLTVLAVPAVARLGRGRRFWVASGMGVGSWATLTLGSWWWGRPIVEQMIAWVGEPTNTSTLVRSWLGVLTSVFLRPGGEGGLLDASEPSGATTAAWVLLGLAATALAAVALWSLAMVPRRERSFVRRLATVPWAALAVVDVLGGGRRSAVARYLVPSWLGVELAAGHWLAAPSLPAPRARRLALLVVLTLAAGTAVRTRNAAFWWDTDAARMRGLADVVAAISARERPVVLTDIPPTALVELVHGLGDDVELRLGAVAPAAMPAREWDRVLVALPSDRLLGEVRRVLGSTRVLAPVDVALPLYAVAAR